MAGKAKDVATATTPKRAPRQRTAIRNTNDWHDVFLADLAEHCNVTHAAKVAKVDKATAYDHRKSDPAFAAAWEDAIESAIETLEYEVRKRARETSDTLAIFLLKAHRPDRYRENRRTELTGANGGPVETRIVFGYDDGDSGDSDG
jgi:hypothetical protein